MLFTVADKRGNLSILESYALDGTIRRGPAKNNLINVQPPFDPERPAWTLDGRRVELTASSPLPMEYPLTFMVHDPAGHRSPVAYSRAGKSRSSPSPLDLTNIPPR